MLYIYTFIDFTKCFLDFQVPNETKQPSDEKVNKKKKKKKDKNKEKSTKSDTKVQLPKTNGIITSTTAPMALKTLGMHSVKISGKLLFH